EIRFITWNEVRPGKGFSVRRSALNGNRYGNQKGAGTDPGAQRPEVVGQIGRGPGAGQDWPTGCFRCPGAPSGPQGREQLRAGRRGLGAGPDRTRRGGFVDGVVTPAPGVFWGLLLELGPARGQIRTSACFAGV